MSNRKRVLRANWISFAHHCWANIFDFLVFSSLLGASELSTILRICQQMCQPCQQQRKCDPERGGNGVSTILVFRRPWGELITQYHACALLEYAWKRPALVWQWARPAFVEEVLLNLVEACQQIACYCFVSFRPSPWRVRASWPGIIS